MERLVILDGIETWTLAESALEIIHRRRDFISPRTGADLAALDERDPGVLTGVECLDGEMDQLGERCMDVVLSPQRACGLTERLGQRNAVVPVAHALDATAEARKWCPGVAAAQWSGRRDSNPRPQRPERCALTKLRHFPEGPSLPERQGGAARGNGGGGGRVGGVEVGPSIEEHPNRPPEADGVEGLDEPALRP